MLRALLELHFDRASLAPQCGGLEVLHRARPSVSPHGGRSSVCRSFHTGARSAAALADKIWVYVLLTLQKEVGVAHNRSPPLVMFSLSTLLTANPVKAGDAKPKGLPLALAGQDSLATRATDSSLSSWRVSDPPFLSAGQVRRGVRELQGDVHHVQRSLRPADPLDSNQQRWQAAMRRQDLAAIRWLEVTIRRAGQRAAVRYARYTQHEQPVDSMDANVWPNDGSGGVRASIEGFGRMNAGMFGGESSWPAHLSSKWRRLAA